MAFPEKATAHFRIDSMPSTGAFAPASLGGSIVAANLNTLLVNSAGGVVDARHPANDAQVVAITDLRDAMFLDVMPMIAGTTVDTALRVICAGLVPGRRRGRPSTKDFFSPLILESHRDDFWIPLVASNGSCILAWAATDGGIIYDDAADPEAEEPSSSSSSLSSSGESSSGSSSPSSSSSAGEPGPVGGGGQDYLIHAPKAVHIAGLLEVRVFVAVASGTPGCILVRAVS